MWKILHSISLCLTASLLYASPPPPPPNILFIAVDDLRPELGSYGNKIVHSPNIDRLASQGLVFNHHYTVVPTCGASRHSLLTGMLPRITDELRNQASARLLSGKAESEQPETFIHHLRRNGYYTVGIGKISHSPDGYVYGNKDPVSEVLELPHSWDEMVFDYGVWETGPKAFFGYADGSDRMSRNFQVKPYESAAVSDDAYADGLIAKLAIKKLRELEQRETPFFLGLGFFKPHLPFTAPEKYWELYKRKEIPLSESPDIPRDINLSSLQNNVELNRYLLGDERATLEHQVSDEYARKLVHAYYASISYVDAQIGKVLNELDRLGLMENTVVVLWGDHGWQLGDYRVWGKHTLFERALRSPLVIKLPGQSTHRFIEDIVSSVDLYPTLLDLSGVPHSHETDGTSLLRFIRGSTDDQPPNIAYSYFGRGISLRTQRYRLTKYYRSELPDLELYDHLHDPHETHNIARQNPDVVTRLMPTLLKGNHDLFPIETK